MSPRNVYVTLLTKNSYLAGTLVLHYGLRAIKSKYPLVAMVTPSLPADARTIVQEQGIQLREVESLKPDPSKHSFNPYDARFENVWTKLR